MKEQNKRYDVIVVGELNVDLILNGIDGYPEIGKEKIKAKKLGQIIEMGNFRLIPTYHPSYLLRNPSAKKEAYHDLLKIKGLL